MPTEAEVALATTPVTIIPTPTQTPVTIQLATVQIQPVTTTRAHITAQTIIQVMIHMIHTIQVQVTIEAIQDQIMIQRQIQIPTRDPTMAINQPIQMMLIAKSHPRQVNRTLQVFSHLQMQVHSPT